jgi:hypothetical protein
MGVMTRRQSFALVVAGLLAAASPVFAHHSWPVDFSRQITIKGMVAEYTWGNPHVMMVMNVDANGRMERWSVGGPSTTRMEANGWDKNTLKAGEMITATGYQFSDGQKVLRLERIVRASGQEMFLYGTGSR